MTPYTAVELAALKRLREGFLSPKPGHTGYWKSSEDLALYDATFAERIGWKWDSVLWELQCRSWRPRATQLLDWGCGTGVASRRLLRAWPGHFSAVTLHDLSASAVQYAARSIEAEFPEVRVGRGDLDSAQLPETLLVVSHVINELTDEALSALVRTASRCAGLLWVDAGARTESRALAERVRAPLLATGKLTLIAPCTHAAACGMLRPENERHWCHSFARPSAEAHQDSRWSMFARELGIDLGTIPYAFVAMEQQTSPGTAAEAPPADIYRAIGEPRDYKGFSKALLCNRDGVSEQMIQKRDAPRLLKQLQRGREAPLYRLELRNGKVTTGGPAFPAHGE